MHLYLCLFVNSCSNHFLQFIESLNPPSRSIFLLVPFSASVAAGLLLRSDNVCEGSKTCEGKGREVMLVISVVS